LNSFIFIVFFLSVIIPLLDKLVHKIDHK